MAETYTCANHPDRETTLRCNRCEKPICSKCAVLTPVGYRCRECVRGQQVVFETAVRTDHAVAAFVAAIGIGAAAAVLNFLGFWGLLAAPVVGGGLAEVIRWAVRRRRSRYLPIAAAAGGGVGLIPFFVMPLARIAASLSGGPYAGVLGAAALGLLWPVGIGVLAIGALYYRLRGIRL